MDADRLRRFAFVPHSVPLEVERAEGCYLVQPGGRRILDASGGAIVANIGWGRREVAEAAARALADCSYVLPPFATPDRVGLAERLVAKWLPPGLVRCTFTSGGSESVEAAVRLARHHHVAAGRERRWKVIGSDISYHGVSLGALAVGGHAARRRGFEPLLIDHPKMRAPYCLACNLGQCPDRCLERLLPDLEALIAREDPETIAAIICEPVIGAAAGAVAPPPDFWPGLRDLTRRYGILLIADEVMTGFGRTGRRFGVDHAGVVPDILIGGKGLAGGYAPIGGLYATEEVVAPIAARGEEPMFYTYSNHPAACAVAECVLEIMEREELVARAARMGEELRRKLEARFTGHPRVAEVRGQGLLLGVQLVQSKEPLALYPAEAKIGLRAQGAGIRHGAFFYLGGSSDRARDALMMGPAFTINGEDLDVMVAALGDAIDEVTAA